jgi:AcrR family transcriptional regulator
MPRTGARTIETAPHEDTPKAAPAEPGKPLRKDAARNRERILEAARDLFQERGLSASLNDIAHHAGVGVGTVYRHFPNKDELIEGLFEQRVAELAARMKRALEDPDPWHGLTAFVRDSTDMQAADRGLKDILVGGHHQLERIGKIRATLMPMGEALVSRAHAAGQLREDIVAQDLPVLQAMMSGLIDATVDTSPLLYRRFLDIVIRGMAARPQDEPPLTGAALEPEEIDQVLSAIGSARQPTSSAR